MSPSTAIVTGANSGLGLACVRSLLERDARWHAVLAVRDVGRGREALTGLPAAERCAVVELDLASLASVRAFPERFERAELPPLRALVCNAGIQVMSPAHRSADGFELMFAVNHLGHFALVQALRGRLTAPARIVVVSSDTHDPRRSTGMPRPHYTSASALARPDDEHAKSQAARLGRERYTTSKLCNVLFAYELDRRLGEGERGLRSTRSTLV
jgi:NAD(P)-dependent dehydrogenase (short-subunit alcohol dehydrogenase family)